MIASGTILTFSHDMSCAEGFFHIHPPQTGSNSLVLASWTPLHRGSFCHKPLLADGTSAQSHPTLALSDTETSLVVKCEHLRTYLEIANGWHSEDQLSQ